MKVPKILMIIMCVIGFVALSISEPSKWETLMWISIAFMNIHIDYN